ncbi:Mapk-regulated corepressor-interacting protein 1 [Plecturocebus cupreus]
MASTGAGVWAPTLPSALSLALGFPSSPVSRVVYNGKRTSSPRSPPSSSEIFTPAHEENVRFIYEGGCAQHMWLLSILGPCRSQLRPQPRTQPPRNLLQPLPRPLQGADTPSLHPQPSGHRWVGVTEGTLCGEETWF